MMDTNTQQCIEYTCYYADPAMPDHSEEICAADEPLHDHQEIVWYNAVSGIVHM